ncbi:M28 family metallopeptidase [Mucilaginibacter koreensis]
MNHKPLYALMAAGLGLLAACNQQENTKLNYAIKPEDIKAHIAVLADDSLMGRKPFTAGETKTINYIAGQYKKLGLQPGNGSSYFQDVPMVEVTSKPAGDMQIGGKVNLSLKSLTDFVATTRQEVPTVEVKNSPLVFAGYGIVAPEFGWNDYKGLDVKGKTVVVLVNDPGFKAKDKKLFHGDTMTYYGRWTYKYEEAARQGAAGVLIVHQKDPASYDWQVPVNSFSGAKLYLQQADKHMSRCKIEGWLTEGTATKMLNAAGIKGDIREYARNKDFKAVPLNETVSVTLNNKLKYSTSHNVVAMLKGSTHPNEYIVYSAHWDHLGIGKPDAKGDSIYNGAVDNASGVAALLSVAKTFAQQKQKPGRSIVFLAVTAEEQGLLGSEYYATHPLYPLNKTVANLNMDALGNYGETHDIAVTGKGQNELEDQLEAIVKKEKLKLTGDKNPGAGSYYRSDHFNFAKVGVPALDINTGADSFERGPDWGKQQQTDYNDNHYHQPSDSYSPGMFVQGMAEIADLMYKLGVQLSNETTFPGWKPGSEFKAVREKSMQK